MKIAIIGTDGLPARYGGFETFVAEVSPRIAAMGHQVRVIGSALGRPAGEEAPAGVEVRNLAMRANGIGSIPFDLASFAAVARWADAVLLLGVSAGPFVPLMRRLSRGGRLLVNVDGLESRRDKWSGAARRYLAFAEAAAIRGARQVVADNDAIADIVRSVYGRASTIIAYGNDHALSIEPDRARRILAERFGLEPGGYLLTVARIEPENNIVMMMDAVPANSRKPYVVLGNFESTPYGRALMERYRGLSAIRMVGAIYDPVVLAALRSECGAYLHGHSVGGTNPALIEMLPYGRPILAFDCAFNRRTLNDEGGYFDDTASLDALLHDPGLARYTPSERLRSDPRYRWQTIAERYVALATQG